MTSTFSRRQLTRRSLRNLHWEQAAAMPVDGGECGRQKLIRRGKSQGCVLSTDLFNEMVQRNIEDIEGLKVGDQKI